MEYILTGNGKKIGLSDQGLPEDFPISIYIDSNKVVWGMCQNLTSYMVESYEGNLGKDFIPGTDFVVLYDESKVLELMGHRFIFYDCLIMKEDKGLKPLEKNEVEEARKAFREQTGNYQAGPFQFNAYKLSED